MSSQSPLVAVVDDEPEVRRALQRLLRSAGFAVEVYASGAAFLDGLPDHRPDCLVLDLHMPGSDGFALQDALSRRGSMIPVVMITGGESVGARARALTGGASAFLCKPMEDTELLAAIRGAIGAMH